MILDYEIAGQVESHDVISSGNAISEAFQIEEVMNRALQIHRAHAGLIGYDLEDWLQAERELVERNRPGQFEG